MYVQSSFSTITRHIDIPFESPLQLKMSRRCQDTFKSIMDQPTCKIYVQQNSFMVSHYEMKIDGGAWEIISRTKIEASTSKNIATKKGDISMIIVRFLFFQIKLVFEFNLALITQSSSQFIYIFTFWYSVYLELSSSSASMRYL